MLLLQVCRLFDLFLATHPLMPLYVGAVAMHSQRSQLLAAEEMPMLHSRLVNLAITKRATADELAMQVQHVLLMLLYVSLCLDSVIQPHATADASIVDQQRTQRSVLVSAVLLGAPCGQVCQ
jgi:hypothetical protein